jgi:TorA maturation chaperone TorD
MQKKFFADHIQAWVNDLCIALAAHPHAKFYVPVAQVARSFFEVEMQAFDMVE